MNKRVNKKITRATIRDCVELGRRLVRDHVNTKEHKK
jgi:hypothetical protein